MLEILVLSSIKLPLYSILWVIFCFKIFQTVLSLTLIENFIFFIGKTKALAWKSSLFPWKELLNYLGLYPFQYIYFYLLSYTKWPCSLKKSSPSISKRWQVKKKKKKAWQWDICFSNIQFRINVVGKQLMYYYFCLTYFSEVGFCMFIEEN